MPHQTMDDDNLPTELKKVLDQCGEEVLAILKPFEQAMESSTTPETIFHYTDDIGLKGILESGNLRLTDMFGLNDPSELKHGSNMSCEALMILGQNDSALNLFAKGYTEIVNQGLEKVANFFVCSFSKDGDDLGQWRSYADDGRGYILAFDADILEKAFSRTSCPDKWGCSAFPMTYNDDQLLELQTKMIEVVLSHVRNLAALNLNKDSGYLFIRGLMVRLALGCTNASIFFKHPAYEHEKEYRFLQLHRSEDKLERIKFRSRPYKLVRYMEYEWIKLAPTALKKIIVGPAADWETAMQFASDCLKAYVPLLGKISIEQSNIPYRGR